MASVDPIEISSSDSDSDSDLQEIDNYSDESPVRESNLRIFPPSISTINSTVSGTNDSQHMKRTLPLSFSSFFPSYQTSQSNNAEYNIGRSTYINGEKLASGTWSNFTDGNNLPGESSYNKEKKSASGSWYTSSDGNKLTKENDMRGNMNDPSLFEKGGRMLPLPMQGRPFPAANSNLNTVFGEESPAGADERDVFQAAVQMRSSSNEEYDIINEEMKREETHVKLVSLLKKDSAEMGNRIDVLQRKLQVLECIEEDVNGIRLKHDLKHEIIAKEQLNHNELIEIRKELIKGLSSGILDIKTSAFGIKWMGKIDEDTFVKTCMLKFPPGKAVFTARNLCSIWQVRLKNSGWYPFKVIEDDSGNFQEVVDDDQLLRELKNEWGDDIHNAVVTAFKELDAYNQSERYPVPELWNLEANRKARLKEVVPFIFKQMKSLKRKRFSIDNESHVEKQETSGNRENVIAVRNNSNDEALERAESEEKPTECGKESDEDKGRKKQMSSETEGNSAAKSEANKVKISKQASLPPEKLLPKESVTEEQSVPIADQRVEPEPVKESRPDSLPMTEEEILNESILVEAPIQTLITVPEQPEPEKVHISEDGNTLDLNDMLPHEATSKLKKVSRATLLARRINIRRITNVRKRPIFTSKVEKQLEHMAKELSQLRELVQSLSTRDHVEKQETSENRENVTAVRKISNDEALERAESEEKPTESGKDSDEDKGKKKQTSSERKENSAAKSEAKEVRISKKASAPPEKSLPKSSKSQLRKNVDSNAINSSGKKKGESVKKPTPKEPAQKESTRKNFALKVRGEKVESHQPRTQKCSF